MSNVASESYFFARQPILDRGGKIMAYELLYRNNATNTLDSLPQHATEELLLNAMNLTGLGNLLEKGTKAFININEHILFSDFLQSVPKSTFVFELLEHIDFTPRIIERIKTLYDSGFTFALDDIVCTKDQIARIKPVLPYVSTVKLDLPQALDAVVPYVTLFKKMRLNVLAEKVESRHEFEGLRDIGCDLFQGFFFAKPTVISGAKINPKLILVFRLINLLTHDHRDEALAIFEQDAALTIQLLRYINSAAFSFKSDIKSIRQATALLGAVHLKLWLTMMSYAIGSHKGMDSPLLKLAQERANMMRLLAVECLDESYADHAAFIGLLSLIDALFNQPLHTLLHELHIAPDIERILTGEDHGTLGKIYSLVQSIETVDHERMDAILPELGLTFDRFASLVVESYELTEAFNHSVGTV